MILLKKWSIGKRVYLFHDCFRLVNQTIKMNLPKIFACLFEYLIIKGKLSKKLQIPCFVMKKLWIFFNIIISLRSPGLLILYILWLLLKSGKGWSDVAGKLVSFEFEDSSWYPNQNRIYICEHIFLT